MNKRQSNFSTNLIKGETPTPWQINPSKGIHLMSIYLFKEPRISFSPPLAENNSCSGFIVPFLFVFPSFRLHPLGLLIWWSWNFFHVWRPCSKLLLGFVEEELLAGNQGELRPPPWLLSLWHTRIKLSVLLIFTFKRVHKWILWTFHSIINGMAKSERINGVYFLHTFVFGNCLRWQKRDKEVK